MATFYETEENLNPVATSGTNHITPSLDDLIAEIDREVGEISQEVPGLKEELLDLSRVSTPVRDQFILFALEDSQFALPLSSALEIGHRPAITPLPNLPEWVLGISNIRGEIISLVNLRVFLGIPSTGATGEQRFIISHNQQMKVGLIVDRILGILSLDRIDSEIQDSPYREGEIANYIRGVAVSGNNLMNILDIGKLLSSSRMTGFRAD